LKTAEVKNYHGVPTLFIDGKASDAVMHWNRFSKSEDVENFKNAGIDFFSFMGRLSIRENGAETDYHDGLAAFPEMSDDYIDKTMSMFVSINPKIKVLPRLRVTVPDWWVKKYPESLIKSFSLKRGCFEYGPHVSLNYPEWKKTLAEALIHMVEYFEKNWGDYVFGYHTGVHDCAEHAYRWGYYISDFSSTQLGDFRTWLRMKYVTEDALQAAWHDGTIRFETAEFPGVDAFFAENRLDSTMLFNPETEMCVVDFLDFSSYAMADAVVFQAHIVKSTLRQLGRKKLYGAFYGYKNVPANLLDHYALGHYDQERVLSCPDVDFLCAPISYDARNKGGCAAPQVVPGSIVKHGKLYYAEEDTRLHLAQNHTDCVSTNITDSRNILLRDFLDIWRSGGTLWWMDLFGEGWFRDVHLMKVLESLQRFAGKTLDQRTSNAQIAVFTSDRSALYMKCSPVSYSGNLVEQALNEICAIGASYDFYRIEDLPLLQKCGVLEQYKFCIMLDIIYLSEECRSLVKSCLECDNRTILWFYLPGAIRDGVWSAKAVADLIGIKLHMPPRLRNSMLTETWLDGVRLCYGHPRNIYPRLTGCDPEAETLGYYVQGVGADHDHDGNGAALVSKRFATWRSVWSASSNMPSCLMTRFAREAGVHLYSERGDQILTLPGLLGIYAKSDGPLDVCLPEPTRVRDCWTGELVAEHCERFQEKTHRGDCLLYRLEGDRRTQ